MKYVLPLYVLLLLTSCQFLSGNSWKEKIVLTIATEHFNDRIIMQELMPIVKSEIWIKGKMRIHKSTTRPSVEVPPPPPIDTVLYGDRRFEEFLQQKILTLEECNWMKNKLENNVHPLRLKAVNHFNIQLEKAQDIYNKNKDKDLEMTMGYYRLSTPLFNKNKNKVLITVESYNPPEGIGHIYVFEKKGKKWIIIYRKGTWIT